MFVVVTGCAGFIGSHLTKRLLHEGMEVYGIDAITDYYDPAIKHRNLQMLKQIPGFRFEQADINSVDLKSMIDAADYIYHLAAQPGVRKSWGTSFGVYTRNNILATQKLLESAKESKRLKKFVFASSSSVYGQTNAEKIPEEHPTRPFSPYGVTKLAAEHLCSLYAANYDMPVVSLRFFTVYGPGQRPDMAFSRLIKAALTGGSFTLFGDGTQERDFTYVDDVVEGLVRSMKSDVCGVFNIGGGHVVSLKEVIGHVERITGSVVKLAYMPKQKGDVRRTSADISRIARALGYAPRVSISEGIRRQVEYVRNNVFLDNNE